MVIVAQIKLITQSFNSQFNPWLKWMLEDLQDLSDLDSEVKKITQIFNWMKIGVSMTGILVGLFMDYTDCF